MVDIHGSIDARKVWNGKLCRSLRWTLARRPASHRLADGSVLDSADRRGGEHWREDEVAARRDEDDIELLGVNDLSSSSSQLAHLESTNEPTNLRDCVRTPSRAQDNHSRPRSRFFGRLVDRLSLLSS